MSSGIGKRTRRRSPAPGFGPPCEDRSPRKIAAAILGVTICLAGCREARLEPSGAEGAATSAARSEETWEALFMAGAKIGHGHTIKQSRLEPNGQRLVETDSSAMFTVARGGQTNQQEMRIVSLETSDGRLVRFSSEAKIGPTPLVVLGNVVDGSLRLEQTQGGRTSRHEISWPPDALGFSAIEDSLAKQPMRPGERRRLKALVPFVNQLAAVELAAADYESTAMLEGQRRLLRIECAITLPEGSQLQERHWTDERGRTFKNETPSIQQVSYRCDRAEALRANGVKVDLMQDLLVRPVQPLRLPERALRAHYVVRLKNADPARIFPNCDYQLVRRVDGATAEVVVWAAGPLQPPAREDRALEPPPGPASLAPSSLMQSDDPQVKALADGVHAGPPGSAERAVALEQTVFKTIAKKNYSQAFASAAEVAKTREGDCTEHAMLLAALCRASGIPARVAVGLVYLATDGAFAFHMWTEVYTGGHWLPLDATLGQARIGVTHLKLADSELANESAMSVFLPVATVLGQLEIEFIPE